MIQFANVSPMKLVKKYTEKLFIIPISNVGQEIIDTTIRKKVYSTCFLTIPGRSLSALGFLQIYRNKRARQLKF